MQYLLTEDEMEAIRRERRDAQKMPTLEALTNVVQHVACYMVDNNPPNCGTPRTRPNGCIHVKAADGATQQHYCDFCSVRGICPLPKEWSK